MGQAPKLIGDPGFALSEEMDAILCNVAERSSPVAQRLYLLLRLLHLGFGPAPASATRDAMMAVILDVTDTEFADAQHELRTGLVNALSMAEKLACEDADADGSSD